MVDLVSVMDMMYSFVDAVKDIPEKIELMEGTIMTILTQTVECVVFIREYSGHGFGGRRLTLLHLFLARVQVRL
jgi:hypothetical protein